MAFASARATGPPRCRVLAAASPWVNSRRVPSARRSGSVAWRGARCRSRRCPQAPPGQHDPSIARRGGQTPRRRSGALSVDRTHLEGVLYAVVQFDHRWPGRQNHPCAPVPNATCIRRCLRNQEKQNRCGLVFRSLAVLCRFFASTTRGQQKCKTNSNNAKYRGDVSRLAAALLACFSYSRGVSIHSCDCPLSSTARHLAGRFSGRFRSRRSSISSVRIT